MKILIKERHMGSLVEDRVNVKLEEEIKANFEQIGRKYYDECKTNGVYDAAYKEFFARIEQLRNEKKNLEINKLAQQGKRRCENCQNVLPIESKFCNMCGQSLPEISSKVKDDNKLKERVCVKCGAVLEQDAVFCSNCGTKNV
jgi:RNA polymerase subunit RPABC4/transcription elongation factor Spt4